MGSFACTLKFVSKGVDPSTGEPEEEGYEDEYQVEEIELSASDYIVPSYATFGSEWDRLKGAPSVTETFALSAMESLKGVFSLLGRNANINRTHSCLRLHHRDSRHGTLGWYGSPELAKRTHVATLRLVDWWWWKDPCALPDDLLARVGCDARAGRAGGKAGGVRPCPRRRRCIVHRITCCDSVERVYYVWDGCKYFCYVCEGVRRLQVRLHEVSK